MKPIGHCRCAEVWRGRRKIPDSLFFPTAHSGDVSSIKDVATLELLADLCPNMSSWMHGKYKHFSHHLLCTCWMLFLKHILHKQTDTDVRVGAVQLREAGGLQEPLPLRNRLGSRGFSPGRCGPVGQRQSAGSPPAHVWTKLICRATHTHTELFRPKEGKHLTWISKQFLILLLASNWIL